MTRGIATTPAQAPKAIAPRSQNPDVHSESAGIQKTVTPQLDTTPAEDMVDQQRLERVKRILYQLRHFELIERLILDYYAATQCPVVPKVVMIPVIDALRTSTALRPFRSVTPVTLDDLASVARAILASTAQAIPITSSTTSTEFSCYLSGAQLRLETLGIIYSVAARSCRFAEIKEGKDYEDFIQLMYENGLECRRIARRTAPMNDALLFLTYELVCLTTYIHGDNSMSLRPLYSILF
jgi:hypothetical protein